MSYDCTQQDAYQEYTTLSRSYTRVSGEQRIDLLDKLIQLHLESRIAFNLVTLEITRLYQGNRLHRTSANKLAPIWQRYFDYFDVPLAAQVFRLLATGTIVTRESLTHLIDHPFSTDDPTIKRFCQFFPDNYRGRTCDLPSWFDHENEATIIPEIKNVTIYSVVEPRIYRVAYDLRIPGDKHSPYRIEQYVSHLDDALLWLDLEDDEGIVGYISEVLIQ